MENKISNHISIKEAIFSPTAERLHIDNTPDALQLQNMKDLAENVFEPLRSGLGNKPIRITSFYRSFYLNKAVGGAKRSQHVALDGSAMDIDNDGYSPTNLEIFNYIKDNLEYDQVILEFPDDKGNPSWIHVSFNKGSNRKDILVSNKVEGRTEYGYYK